MIKKISKILAICSIPLAVSISTISSIAVDKTTINILGSNKQDDVATYGTPTDKVNWINSTDKPTSFSDSVPMAQTDSSPAITTSFGVMGLKTISGKKSEVFMMSYSGVVMWWQVLTNNPFLKDFYQQNSMTITNVEVQQFAYLESKQAIVLLIGDNDVNNQSIMIVDAKTGLMWNPVLNQDNEMTDIPIFKVSTILQSGSSNNNQPVDRMYAVTNDTVILNRFGDYNTYKDSIKISLSGNNSSNIVKEKIRLSNYLGSTSNNNNTLMGLYNAGNNQVIALTRDLAEISSGNKTYKQYAKIFDFKSITTVQNANVLTLSNSYISKGDGSDSYMNFSYVDGNNFYVLTGNNESRMLNKLTKSGYSLVEQKTSNVDLSNYGINTISTDTRNKQIFIGNKTTKNNVTAGYINLNDSKPTFIEIFRTSSSTTFTPYYLIPVIENIGNNTQQYVLYLDSSNQLTYVYKSTSQTKFEPSNKKFGFSSRNDDIWSRIKNKGDAIFKNKMASAVTYNDIKDVINLDSYSNGNYEVAFKNTSNNDNGTLTITLTISYPWMFDSSQKSRFEIPLNFNGFYKMTEGFKFKFIKSSSDDNNKWNEIEKLKKSKFAKSITQDEVFQNFWTGSIKNKDGQDISISKEMFSLGFSDDYGTLNVTFTVPSNQVPEGFPNITNKYSFSGFLSTNGYETTAKSDTDINRLIQDLYPSQLTKERILTFITIGEKVKKELSYWEIQIDNVDDFAGTATISAKYIYESDDTLPDRDNFPVDRFNVFDNKQLTGFKNINSQLGAKPTMNHLDSDYLPSEIWEQYLNYKKGLTNQSILLDNLTLNIADKNSVEIILLNPDSCDADKFLNLEINLKNGDVLNINYTGTQYQKTDDNKLMFNDALKAKLTEAKPDFYPLTIKWEITTKDKAFDVLGPNGTYIQQSNNIYYIDVRELDNDQNYLLSKDQYADEISEDTVSKLIQVQGYTYDYLQYKVDKSKGTITAVIQLNTLNSNIPGNGDSNENEEDNPSTGQGDSDIVEPSSINLKAVNSNYIRTIYIYNFKLPLPGYVNILTFSIIGTVVTCAVGAGLWYLVWNRKKTRYNKMGIDIKQQAINRKKLMLLKRKIELTERIKEKSSSANDIGKKK